MTPTATSRHGDATRDRGQVTAFTLSLLTALLLVAGLVLDGGLALAAKVQALDEAQEAARAGAQHLDLARYRATGAVILDPTAADNAAHSYLAATGHPGVVTVTADTVTVTVTITGRTQLLQLTGLTHFHVDGTATATPQRGITAPEP